MTLLRPLRKAYIKTTDFTHGFQGKGEDRLRWFYRLWAPVYDVTVGLDPAYRRNLAHTVEATVNRGDTTLDVGCGTGIATIHAASIATRVVAVDPSSEMLTQLSAKIARRSINNIEARTGYFPDVIADDERFDSVVSSFMLAHLTPVEQARAICAMFAHLRRGGRLGLFSAQGEVAPTFQLRDAINDQLSAAGFANVHIEDVSDIYRITTATKP